MGFDQRAVILQWLNFDVIVKSDRRFEILLVVVSRQLEHLAVVAGRADQQIPAQFLDAPPQNPRFSQKFFAAAFGIGFAEDRQIIGIGQRNQLEQVLQTGLVFSDHVDMTLHNFDKRLFILQILQVGDSLRAAVLAFLDH